MEVEKNGPTEVLPALRVPSEMLRKIEAFVTKYAAKARAAVGLLNVSQPDAVRYLLERGLEVVEAEHAADTSESLDRR
jgi:hypothetical protein